MKKGNYNKVLLSVMSIFCISLYAKTEKPTWNTTERFDREYVMMLNAKPEDIFPLLCPVKEYEWLNGWKCRMLFSKSGYAEEGAMFYTASGFPLYRRLNFFVTEYSQNKRIRFLIVINKIGTIDFWINLFPQLDKTKLTWHYTVTSHSKLGTKLLMNELSPDKFTRTLKSNEMDLVYFLRMHKKRNKKNE